MTEEVGGSAQAFDEVFEPLVDAAVGQAAAELDAELVELRRDVHRWPELAGRERRTAALVAERLRAAGLLVQTGVGGHGVVAVVRGTGGSAGDGPTVAYRADMDAVAGDETACPAGFASRVPGAAHLCGHDLHTAVGVGVALVLARLRDRIRGRVIVVFQPAAETWDGAAAMIADGLLDCAMPREIYALHCAPLPVGTLGALPGIDLPGHDRFTVRLLPIGPADRAAAEAEARTLAARLDALSTAREPATAEEWRRLCAAPAGDGRPARDVVVRTIVEPGRAGASDGDCLGVQADGGRSDGSDGGRALSGEAGGLRIRGTVLALPDGRFGELRAAVRDVVARHPGTRVEFAAHPFPAVTCPPGAAEAGARRIRRTLGSLRASGAVGDDAEVVTLHGAPPYGSHDAARFLRRVPGAMFCLGVGDASTGPAGLPHHPGFAPDERAIGIGVRTMTALLCHRITALT